MKPIERLFFKFFLMTIIGMGAITIHVIDTVVGFAIGCVFLIVGAIGIDEYAERSKE